MENQWASVEHQFLLVFLDRCFSPHQWSRQLREHPWSVGLPRSGPADANQRLFGKVPKQNSGGKLFGFWWFCCHRYQKSPCDNDLSSAALYEPETMWILQLVGEVHLWLYSGRLDRCLCFANWTPQIFASSRGSSAPRSAFVTGWSQIARLCDRFQLIRIESSRLWCEGCALLCFDAVWELWDEHLPFCTCALQLLTFFSWYCLSYSTVAGSSFWQNMPDQLIKDMRAALGDVHALSEVREVGPFRQFGLNSAVRDARPLSSASIISRWGLLRPWLDTTFPFKDLVSQPGMHMSHNFSPFLITFYGVSCARTGLWEPDRFAFAYSSQWQFEEKTAWNLYSHSKYSYIAHLGKRSGISFRLWAFAVSFPLKVFLLFEGVAFLQTQ